MGPCHSTDLDDRMLDAVVGEARDAVLGTVRADDRREALQDLRDQLEQCLVRAPASADPRASIRLRDALMKGLGTARKDA